MKINKQYKIIKATKKSIVGAIFEYVIINKGESVEPKWFKEFRKENDALWAEQMKFNKHVEEFIKYVLDVFKRNNLK